jgi:hypothetical protein
MCTVDCGAILIKQHAKMVKVIDFQSIFKNGKNGKPIQVFKSKDSTTQEHKDTHQQIEKSKSI